MKAPTKQELRDRIEDLEVIVAARDGVIELNDAEIAILRHRCEHLQKTVIAMRGASLWERIKGWEQ